MIHLKSITIKNFKGITNYSCEFDDLTVLVGPNNSGKSTILQAAYLLFSILPKAARVKEVFNDTKPPKISLDDELGRLGLHDTKWLFSVSSSDEVGEVIGTFSNSLSVHLGLDKVSPGNLSIHVTDNLASTEEASRREQLVQLGAFIAEIMLPPGEIPSQEGMLTGNDYQNHLRRGQGNRLWRNGVWWTVQEYGFESFAPIQKKIKEYFPQVELLLPTLGLGNPSEIQIKYRSGGKAPLDIAQSGTGLRTFMALSQILEQSNAQLILLDEPDSHLHASQQKVAIDLLMDAAATSGRQVILATHSPEIINRVPPECLRWVDRNATESGTEHDVATMMEKLGVTAELYMPSNDVPDILVYVEGKTDVPIIEGLIHWYRKKHDGSLPSTKVVYHRDGRYDATALQGIARSFHGLKRKLQVIGIRDLDWYYCELPKDTIDKRDGDGWVLITLSVKESENLLCDAFILHQAYGRKIAQAELQAAIELTSSDVELIDEWRFQVTHRIRERLPRELDNSTKEKLAEEQFGDWKNNAELRQRLVAGKQLLARIKQRIKSERQESFNERRIFESIDELSPILLQICQTIFP